MRWLLLIFAIFGFIMAFSTRSPGLVGIGLLIGFIGLLSSLWAFAAARIASTSRPESTLLADREASALRASLRKTGSSTTPNPPDRPT